MKIWTHFLSLVALAALTNMACAVDSKHTTAADGSRIAYTVHGSGPIALVFVHGWSCDQDYWDAQTTFFAEQYTVVTVDLAGHGDSSAEREQFTLESFGGDVKAVVEAEKLNEVILIGHSMGGVPSPTPQPNWGVGSSH